MSSSQTWPEPLSKDSDSVLIERFLDGDEERASQQILERHVHSVYRFIYSMIQNQQDSEDLCQQTFSRVFVALPGYREEGHFRAWIFRIARNEVLTFLRKRKSRPLIEREIEDGDFPTTRDSSASKDSVSFILKTIEKLPKKQREVVKLRLHEGLAFREIAECLGMPIGSVLSSMNDARIRLRDELKPLLNESSESSTQ